MERITKSKIKKGLKLNQDIKSIKKLKNQALKDIVVDYWIEPCSDEEELHPNQYPDYDNENNFYYSSFEIEITYPNSIFPKHIRVGKNNRKQRLIPIKARLLEIDDFWHEKFNYSLNKQVFLYLFNNTFSKDKKYRLNPEIYPKNLLFVNNEFELPNGSDLFISGNYDTIDDAIKGIKEIDDLFQKYYSIRKNFNATFKNYYQKNEEIQAKYEKKRKFAERVVVNSNSEFLQLQTEEEKHEYYQTEVKKNMRKIYDEENKEINEHNAKAKDIAQNIVGLYLKR